MYPKIEIYMNKLLHNTKIIVDKCKKSGIAVAGVTKACCGSTEVAEVFMDGGVSFLADSRIENLEKISWIPLPKILLRIPMLSQTSEVVKWADISLNSHMETIERLGEEAIKQYRVHGIIVMVDLGDLREGFLPSEIELVAKKLKDMEGIKVIGVGTNLTCYGGVIPNEKNLGSLIELKNKMERILGYTLEYIGGGNSSTLHLLDRDILPKGINLLRIGEGILLGRETAFGLRIKDTYDDVFILKGEIIEVREKPSIPTGELGMDAFGNKPKFTDKGNRKRGIIAIGKQDVDIHGLIPFNQRIEVFGGSSDHLIIDITDTEYNLGDIVPFKVNYSALLGLMTSPYVFKEYINRDLEE